MNERQVGADVRGWCFWGVGSSFWVALIVCFMGRGCGKAYGQEDLDPPVVQGVSLAGPISTARSDAWVPFTVEATDNLSGVNAVYVYLISPLGDITRKKGAGRRDIVAGDNKSGMWQGWVRIPQYSQIGDWSLMRVEAKDYVGNISAYDAGDIQANGWGATISNTNSPKFKQRDFPQDDYGTNRPPGSPTRLVANGATGNRAESAGVAVSAPFNPALVFTFLAACVVCAFTGRRLRR